MVCKSVFGVFGEALGGGTQQVFCCAETEAAIGD
jgi:hypothetical protein